LNDFNPERDMKERLERALDIAIYLSTFLGFVFLVIAWGTLPYWLYSSIVFGFFLYLLASLLTFYRKFIAYLLSLVLAALVLSTSLPQGVHYQFLERGEILPATVFLAGDLLQGLIIVLFIARLIAGRKNEGMGH
jgi:hypothetical protein